jgi:hypothetical protein
MISSTSNVYANRTISFVINDGTEDSTVATDTVDVTGPPVVTTSGGSTTFIAGDNTASALVVVDSTLTVTDASSLTLASATVSVTGNFQRSEDALAFINTGAATYGNITASYDSTSGVLMLTSSGATATLAKWRAALGAVTYTDTVVTPDNASRTVTFIVNDGTQDSAQASKTVTVGDVDQTPIGIATSGTTAYVAPYSGTAAPLSVDPGFTVSDADNVTLASATVSVTGNLQSSEDVLAFINTGAATYGNITASYNSTSGVLMLTSSGATATLAKWQAALEAVTYTDTATTPNIATRTVTFIVNDGAQDSAPATKHVTVTKAGPVPVAPSASTSTALATSANPVTVGTEVTYTATISPVPQGGTVNFTDGGAAIPGCTDLIVGAGAGAVCATTYAASGTEDIEASYSGSTGFVPSAAPTLVEKVTEGPSTTPPPVSPSCNAPGTPADNAFICQVYVDLLGGTPNSRTIGRWAPMLQAGTSRAQVAYDILTSAEYRTNLVQSYYQTYLGRAADPEGLAQWLGKLNSGWSDQGVLAGIISSPEYYSKSGGDPADFVTHVYKALLGRSPDAAGLAYWRALLAAGVSRSTVVSEICSSPEYRRSFVEAEYAKLLLGPVQPAALSGWVAELAGGASQERVIAGIVGSAEFYLLATSPSLIAGSHALA